MDELTRRVDPEPAAAGGHRPRGLVAPASRCAASPTPPGCSSRAWWAPTSTRRRSTTPPSGSSRSPARFDRDVPRSVYDGIAEAAMAGAEPDAFFDHSPMIGRANPLAPPIALELADDLVVGSGPVRLRLRGPARLRARRLRRLRLRRGARRGADLLGRAGHDRHAHDPLPQAHAAAHRPALRGPLRPQGGPQGLHLGPALRRRPAHRRGRGHLRVDPVRALRRSSQRAERDGARPPAS